MEKSTKIIISVIVFGVAVPLAIILLLAFEQEKKATDILGIRDYKAGRYNAAILELSSYLKTHPYTEDHGLLPGKPQYAQHYLGLALLKQHRYAEAVSVFRIYAQYAGGNEKNYLLGVALFDNGNTVEARAKFREAIDNEMQQPFGTRDKKLISSSEKWLAKIDNMHQKS